MSCVHLNKAIVLWLASSVTWAFHTWVVRPLWTMVAMQAITPSRAVCKSMQKLLFSAMVVKFYAPATSRLANMVALLYSPG